MLNRLAQVVLRSPRLVLVLTLLVVLIAVPAAAGLMSRVSEGGWDVPGSESDHASLVLAQHFGEHDPNLALLVTDQRGINNPAVSAAGTALTRQLATEAGVRDVTSYWIGGRAATLGGKNNTQALIVGHIDGDFDTALRRVKELAPKYTGTVNGMRVQVGGTMQMWNDNLTNATSDAEKADGLVFPVMLIVLVLIFGSLTAALLPLAVAMVTIVISMGLFWMLTFSFQLSTFVLNTATFVGMGLAIDYSLLIVSRYREERRRGLTEPAAIATAVRTAGRTVLFSAICVAVALMALFVVPFPFFASLAIGAIATTLFAAVCAVTIVPALITLQGPRLDRLRIFGMKWSENLSQESAFWRRTATRVMNRPVIVSVVVLALLMLMGLPSLGMKLRLQDEQVLPPSAASAQVLHTIEEQFPIAAGEAQAIKVVADGIGNPRTRSAQLDRYAQKLSTLPHVASVNSLTGLYVHGAMVSVPAPASARFATDDATYLSIIPNTDGYSPYGADLVRAVRAAPAPFRVLVGGTPAVAVDTFDRLDNALPWAIAVLGVSMFILLFLLTGSVLLPLGAIVLTTLSLTATFGALVYIFQNGHLRWLIGSFTATGATIWTVPIILFSMAFGLSMDYQVFIMSRIKEERDQGKDNTTAVIDGLARTGRVVTSAALVISTVCAVWITSGIGYMKAFGLGIPLAIILDATLVRGTLLPALMKLLSEANWWAPTPLRKVHDRIGIKESIELPSPQPEPEAATAG